MLNQTPISKPSTIRRESEFLPGLSSILIGTGLWLLNGPGNIPPVLAWFAATILSVGAFMLLLKGFKSFSEPETATRLFTYPLALGIGIGIALILIEHLLRYLAFPYPLDDGEGFVLNQAIRIASHQPLYPPLGGPPYLVTNYPPFFPVLLSFFTDPANVSFLPGRLISSISTLAIFLSSVGIVRAITGNRTAGIIAGLLAVASPVIYFWGALLRVDLLASALGAIALWIGVSQKGWKVLWAVPVCLAALYTRQSSVEAAFAIAVALFLGVESGENKSNSRTRALVFAAAWAIGAIAIFLILQMMTSGEFLLHTVSYTRTQFFPSRIWSAVQWLIPSHALILILAIFALSKAITDPRRRILGYFFSASIATSLLSGKVGSDLNYFINFGIASACLAGCLFADLASSIKGNSHSARWIAAAMLLFPAALAQAGLIEGNRPLSFTPGADDYLSGGNIVEILSQAKGPILSEDEGFCLLSGHQVVFNPFIMSELAREGIWDQRPFVEWIRSKGPEIIMLRFDVNDPYSDDRPGAGSNAGWDRWTEEMERVIGDSYEIDKTVSPLQMRRLWFIYRPKQ